MMVNWFIGLCNETVSSAQANWFGCPRVQLLIRFQFLNAILDIDNSLTNYCFYVYVNIIRNWHCMKL